MKLETRPEIDLELLLQGEVACEVDGHFDAPHSSYHHGGAEWKFEFSCPRDRSGTASYMLMCDRFHTLIMQYMEYDDTATIGCNLCGAHSILDVYTGSVKFG